MPEKLRQEYNISIDSVSGQELTQHGTPDFPVMVYHTVFRDNVLGYVNWHWHRELQFCIVTRGAAEFFVSGRRYAVREGDGIFINSGYLHMARALQDPDSAYYCVDADAKLLAGFAGSALEQRCVLPYLDDEEFEDMVLTAASGEQGTILRKIRAVAEEYAERAPGSELRITALLMEIWDGILRQYEKTGRQAADGAGMEGRKTVQGSPAGESGARMGRAKYALVREIMTYIRTHYAERIAIEDIARAVSFSGSECCRRFREVTGQTIFGYLQDVRITQATAMLRESSASVAQIAYENGFCSTSYLIEVFRKRTGMTPLQYRKRQA